MKKKIFAAILGIAAVCGIGFSLNHFSVSAVRAEDETSELASELTSEQSSEEISASEEEQEEIKIGKIVIDKVEHGSVKVDVEEGEVGTIVTVNADADLCFLVESVSVNGTALIESEETRGLFQFALVEGENRIIAKFVVDKELLGTFSDMFKQASEGDWTNLFSVKNVITIVLWLLDGGLLLVMVRYYIKDKKLEKKIEESVNENIKKIIPESTKQTVVATVEKVITPIFTDLQSEMLEMHNAMSVFAKVLALSQENSPEARVAILNALQELNISDQNSINDTKKYIESLIVKHEKDFKEAIESLEKISGLANENKSVSEITNKKEEKQEGVSKPVDDGTQF